MAPGATEEVLGEDGPEARRAGGGAGREPLPLGVAERAGRAAKRAEGVERAERVGGVARGVAAGHGEVDGLDGPERGLAHLAVEVLPRARAREPLLEGDRRPEAPSLGRERARHVGAERP